MKRLRPFCAVVASIVLAAFAAGPLSVSAEPSIQQRIEAQKVKAEQTQAQLHQKRSQLHSVTLRYDDLNRQLGETNDAIAGVNAHLGGLAASA
ncbi:MAG TPA: hypothetical protein VGF18_03925, partial [Candidatus Tumulicola sp.]